MCMLYRNSIVSILGFLSQFLLTFCMIRKGLYLIVISSSRITVICSSRSLINDQALLSWEVIGRPLVVFYMSFPFLLSYFISVKQTQFKFASLVFNQTGSRWWQKKDEALKKLNVKGKIPTFLLTAEIFSSQCWRLCDIQLPTSMRSRKSTQNFFFYLFLCFLTSCPLLPSDFFTFSMESVI